MAKQPPRENETLQETLGAYERDHCARFHMPGHKGRGLAGFWRDELAGWDGTSPRALAEELLRQSVQRTGGADDCAVLVLAIDGKADPHRV